MMTGTKGVASLHVSSEDRYLWLHLSTQNAPLRDKGVRRIQLGSKSERTARRSTSTRLRWSPLDTPDQSNLRPTGPIGTQKPKGRIKVTADHMEKEAKTIQEEVCGETSCLKCPLKVSFHIKYKLFNLTRS